MITIDDEIELARRLVQIGMGTLIPESEVARASSGQLLRAGWFAVPHRQDRLRLILDRRPMNVTERDLPWRSLPHGTDLCKLIITPGNTVRASSDDLSNFFFQWQHRPEWRGRQAVGRRLRASSFSDLVSDLDHHQHYRLSINVIGMGDKNGVSICQAAHVGLLEQAGCMLPHERLEYNQPPRRAPFGREST